MAQRAPLRFLFIGCSVRPARCYQTAETSRVIRAHFGELLFVALLVSCTLVPPESQAEDLRMAFGQGRPPFVFEENGMGRGFEIAIVREALGYRGHTVGHKSHMPNSRLADAVARSGFDGAVSVQHREDGTYYSEDFVTYINYAISKKKDKVTVDAIRDLTNYRTVAWQNAYLNLGPEFVKFYGPEAEGDHLGRYKEFANQEHQNLFFWKGRADVIIVDRTIFLWFRKRLSDQLDTSAEVTFHDIFGKETHYQVNFRDEGIRDDFDEGLKHLRSSGRYQELIDAYIE